MTERAMPEGELRETIATALLSGYRRRFQKLDRWVLSPEAPDMNDARNMADEVMAVLRPHLGLGDAERAIMLRELDLIERDVSEFEGAELRRWIAERVMVLRAVAGRGEAEGE